MENGQGFPSGHSVTFLAAANNQWATNRIMQRAGVQVGGYTGHWLDIVPNVIGLNIRNPVQIALNIILSWHLFTPYSVHSNPPVKP